MDFTKRISTSPTNGFKPRLPDCIRLLRSNPAIKQVAQPEG